MENIDNTRALKAEAEVKRLTAEFDRMTAKLHTISGLADQVAKLARETWVTIFAQPGDTLRITLGERVRECDHLSPLSMTFPFHKNWKDDDGKAGLSPYIEAKCGEYTLTGRWGGRWTITPEWDGDVTLLGELGEPWKLRMSPALPPTQNPYSPSRA